MLESAIQVITGIGTNIGLLVIGIIMIVIGAVGPMFAPQGGKGWYAILVIGIIVVVVWLVLLLVSYI